MCVLNAWGKKGIPLVDMHDEEDSEMRCGKLVESSKRFVQTPPQKKTRAQKVKTRVRTYDIQALVGFSIFTVDSMHSSNVVQMPHKLIV